MAELEPEEQKRCWRLPKGAVSAVGLALALGALAFSRTRRRAHLKAHQEALKRLAEESGCGFIPAQPESPCGPDFPAMAGTCRGRNVRIDNEVVGASLRNEIVTRFIAEHSAPVEGFLVVREETVFTRMANHLGLADLQVGERAFDDRFEVATDLPDVLRLLPPEVRDSLLAADFESFVIRYGEVMVRQRGPVTDAAMLRQSLKLAVDVAEWLETLG